MVGALVPLYRDNIGKKRPRGTRGLVDASECFIS